MEGNGFEAWRLICREYESRAIPRRLAMLQELLRPHFGATTEMKTDFLNWERDVALYETQTGKVVDRELLIAVLLLRMLGGAFLYRHISMATIMGSSATWL